MEVFLFLPVEILKISGSVRQVMDLMQWSLMPAPPPSGSAWPAVPQEFNETLALTTALGYSLLACETCMLNCCFDPVSTPGVRSGCRAQHGFLFALVR